MPKRPTPRAIRKVLDELEVPEKFRTELPTRSVGAPSTYTPAIAALICTLIEDGKTIRDIEKTEGMPAWETIRRWLNNRPEFQAQYARAYESSAWALECEALDQVRNATDADTAAAARARLDAIKWATAKRNPKVYGEKVKHDVSGEIVHTTPDQRRAKIEQLEKRLGRAVPPTIDGKVEE